jgi:hypothetical protein
VHTAPSKVDDLAARTQDATDSAKASAQSTADKASAKAGEVRAR